ncbi:MAG TPA: hypothetical protein VF148_12805 [Acidimicrobiia bacterium]
MSQSKPEPATVIATPPEMRESLVVDRLDYDRIVVYDEQGGELLALDGLQRYWVQAAILSPDGRLVATADSQSRLAIFDRASLGRIW